MILDKELETYEYICSTTGEALSAFSMRSIEVDGIPSTLYPDVLGPSRSHVSQAMFHLKEDYYDALPYSDETIMSDPLRLTWDALVCMEYWFKYGTVSEETYCGRCPPTEEIRWH